MPTVLVKYISIAMILLNFMSSRFRTAILDHNPTLRDFKEKVSTLQLELNLKYT